MTQTKSVWVALAVIGSPGGGADADDAPSVWLKVAATYPDAQNLLIELLSNRLDYDEGETLGTDTIDLIRAARPTGPRGERSWFYTPEDNLLEYWGLYEEPVRSQVTEDNESDED